MDDKYDLFAKYYRELISVSGHLNNEINTVAYILNKFAGNNFGCKILDAACGTGDALLEIHKRGYSNISGLDGSAQMIRRAKELLPDINYYNRQWEKLSETEDFTAKYDLITVLSISLLHSTKAYIPSILESFFNILENNGTVVFDNRRWETVGNRIVEINREEGVFIRPVEIFNNDTNTIIVNKCEYHEDRQHITYKIYDQNHLIDETFITFEYAIISSIDFLKILANIGFKEYGIINFPNWPYEIIYATK